MLLAWYRTQTDSQSRQEASRLATALVQHWQGEAEHYSQSHRYRAAVGALREALRISPEPAVQAQLHAVVAILDKLAEEIARASRQIGDRQFAEARETLLRVLQIQPDLAIAHGKLGTVLAILGQKDQAVKHLQVAANNDPDNPYGYAMLGWLAYLDDKPDIALADFRRADAIEPYDAKIHYQMGLAQAKLRHWPDAEASFRQVLLIDPYHILGHVGLSQALGQQEKWGDAVRVARTAVRLFQV